MSLIIIEESRKPSRVVLIGFLLLSVVLSFASSSSISSIPAVSSKRRRRNKMFHGNEDFAMHSPGNCDGRAVIPTHRKACGFYIWDFPSAVLYKWCHRLLKDRVYEGKGGYIFVRYESNSILKLLYPCTRYSPNKCMICGGSYEDHLELWWSKHLYSPFDQYLDRTYNEALAIRDEETGTSNQRARRDNSNKQRNRTSQNNRNRRSQTKSSSSSSPVQILSEPPYFSFHKRYVEDVTDVIRGIKDPRERTKLVRKRHPAKSNHIMISSNDVTYITPHVGGYGNKLDNYSKKDAMIDIVAIMLYSCVDATINLQHWEFNRKKLRKRLARNRP